MRTLKDEDEEEEQEERGRVAPDMSHPLTISNPAEMQGRKRQRKASNSATRKRKRF